VGLAALRVLDRTGARTLGVEQRQQAADVDRLTRAVEHVLRPGIRDVDPQRLAHQIEVDHGDRQPAVQRRDVAGVDRRVDRRHAIRRGFNKIFGGGLAAAGRLEAAVAQQVAHRRAHAVVAAQRGGEVEGEAGEQLRRRGQVGERAREHGDEGAEVEQRVGCDGQHGGGGDPSGRRRSRSAGESETT
jgi:hypothetical protein